MVCSKKLVILFVALFAVVFSKAEDYAENQCSRNTDCGSDGCCITRISDTSVCGKKGREGDKCSLSKLKIMGEDIHLGVCPCAEGLECRAGNIEVKGDEKIYHDIKCRIPS